MILAIGSFMFIAACVAGIGFVIWVLLSLLGELLNAIFNKII